MKQTLIVRLRLWSVDTRYGQKTIMVPNPTLYYICRVDEGCEWEWYRLESILSLSMSSTPPPLLRLCMSQRMVLANQSDARI